MKILAAKGDIFAPGDRVAGEFDDVWHTGTVMKLSPKLVIRYDDGHVETNEPRVGQGATLYKLPINTPVSRKSMTKAQMLALRTAVPKRDETKLVALINKARIAYGRGQPIMTDLEYDRLEDELRAINPDAAILKHSGASVSTKMKVKLPYPMPSLTKAKYQTGAVGPWLQRTPGPYVVSWKMDGVSALKTKSAAAPTRLFTRGRSGDGYGGDISYLLPHLKLPRSASKKGQELALRGELLMANGTFAKKYAADFANPRNMAAGLTNKKEIHPAVKDLDFIVYEVMAPRMKLSRGLALAKSLGYHVVPHKVFPTLTEEKLLSLLKKARANGKYEVDGLVVVQDAAHPIARSDPDWAIAFKSDTEDDAKTTTVIDIEWNLTRTGQYFPRVVVEPVSLKGVTVRYASAKSAEFVKTNGIGPGAVIRLRRSGDVIPDIRAEDVIKKGKPKWPTNYEWRGANIGPKGGVEGNADVRAMQIEHFFAVLGIERFKAATIAKYVTEGYDSVIKILRMSESQFTAVEGVSKTSRVIYQEIQKLKADGAPLHELMYASGVFGRALGSRKFNAIIDAVPNIMDRALDSTEKLVRLIDDIPGFDVKQAQMFASGLPRFLKFLNLSRIPAQKIKKIKTTSAKLSGQSVLFTGFRNAELETAIQAAGGKIASSVKSATILLAKDVGGSSSKLAAARAAGIKIMTEQQFRQRYGV